VRFRATLNAGLINSKDRLAVSGKLKKQIQMEYNPYLEQK
jgi:hypothetical protein